MAPEEAATVRRAVMHLGRRLRAERPAGALSGNKLSVLSHLYRHGPTTPGAIAAAERQQPQSLTRTFTELRRAGLITRRPGEHDRREAVLTITDAGLGVLVRDMADRDAWLAGAMEALTEAEAEMLRIAAGLMERLAARPGIAHRRTEEDLRVTSIAGPDPTTAGVETAAPAASGPPSRGPSRAEPAWARYAVWWHVYPLGFTGADTTGAYRRPVHGLARLAAWLDYAVELGASGIALGPIFDSATHGYDTIDHFRIDPRLGDDADFDALVARAHERGLRVLLDGVFNHVGRGFPAFAEILAAGPTPERADWFVRVPGDGPGEERDDGRADGPRYAVFEGHDGLVRLNHANPAVADHVAEVMIYWLDRGADGWRLDAAYAVPPAFWAEVLPRVRAVHPDAYLVGEVLHGDYAAIVRAASLDAVTQYELWKAVWSSLNDRNLFELAWALGRHNTWLETFVPLTFVGNHDVTRLASQVTDARHLPHALVVLLTVAGTPCVYYGDEQAFVGVKEDRAGGDDAVRPSFPAGPTELAPYGWPTYRLHQQLIGLRRRHPWLHAARTRVVHLANEQLTYESSGEGQSLTVALNLADAPREQPAPGAVAVLAGAGTILRPGGDDTLIRLPPHGWAVLAPTP